MSYELPRPAKLKVDLQSKYIGKTEGRLHKAGKKVNVQRSPAEPGVFIVWFGKTEIAKVQSLDLVNTIEYTDGREKL